MTALWSLASTESREGELAPWFPVRQSSICIEKAAGPNRKIQARLKRPELRRYIQKLFFLWSAQIQIAVFCVNFQSTPVDHNTKTFGFLWHLRAEISRRSREMISCREADEETASANRRNEYLERTLYDKSSFLIIGSVNRQTRLHQITCLC